MTGEVGNSTDAHRILSNLRTKEIVKKVMYEKGSESYGINAVISIGHNFTIIHDVYNNQDSFSNFVDEIYNARDSEKEEPFRILLFSRQPPEMEINDQENLPQPYYNPYENAFYAVHGTIKNVDEICDKYNIKVAVDTDIFALLPQNALDECEGSFIYCQMPVNKPTRFVYTNNSGLGMWRVDANKMFEPNNSIRPFHVMSMTRVFDTDALISKEIFIIDRQNSIAEYKNNMDYYNNRVAIALFSGGLDITSTVIQYKKDNPNIPITGIYFNWGSNASKQEIEAGYKAVENNILDEYIVFDTAADIMKNIFQTVGVNNIRLMDSTAEGAGEAEAESSMSYVPFRNTFFLTLAAAWTESHYPNQYADILIGGNLTEAMGGYNDSSNAYLDAMENVLKLGGKTALRYAIYAPFVNKTKTMMLSSFDIDELNKIFDISFSCYFPTEDGEPCGKCGSCLLRQTAIERAMKDNNDGESV
jgi:7-cyano-7-deazaguanine synthase